MRLIDADDLYRKVLGYKDGAVDKSVAKRLIEQVPSADVRENVHGNWVGIDDDEPCETSCDRCGFVLDNWILGAFYNFCPNFCPNCGADMRGKQDDNE